MSLGEKNDIFDKVYNTNDKIKGLEILNNSKIILYPVIVM